jgi:hypothetical protein
LPSGGWKVLAIYNGTDDDSLRLLDAGAESDAHISYSWKQAGIAA